MSIIEVMVIDMNEAQVRIVEQVRQVLQGTQALEFRAAEDAEGRYRWIDAVLRRLDCRVLRRADRGAVLAYVQRLSSYSRAQVTRLVSRWVAGQPLAKNYRAPEHAFARRYTPADIALLAEVDRAMGTLSGPATACVLRRQRDVFGDARFARLGSISVAHLYNLRKAQLPRAARGADQDPRRQGGGDRGAQGTGARGPPRLRAHRQRSPGRGLQRPQRARLLAVGIRLGQVRLAHGQDQPVSQRPQSRRSPEATKRHARVRLHSTLASLHGIGGRRQDERSITCDSQLSADAPNQPLQVGRGERCEQAT